MYQKEILTVVLQLLLIHNICDNCETGEAAHSIKLAILFNLAIMGNPIILGNLMILKNLVMKIIRFVILANLIILVNLVNLVNVVNYMIFENQWLMRGKESQVCSVRGRAGQGWKSVGQGGMGRGKTARKLTDPKIWQKYINGRVDVKNLVEILVVPWTISQNEFSCQYTQHMPIF